MDFLSQTYLRTELPERDPPSTTTTTTTTISDTVDESSKINEHTTETLLSDLFADSKPITCVKLIDFHNIKNDEADNTNNVSTVEDEVAVVEQVEQQVITNNNNEWDDERPPTKIIEDIEEEPPSIKLATIDPSSSKPEKLIIEPSSSSSSSKLIIEESPIQNYDIQNYVEPPVISKPPSIVMGSTWTIPANLTNKNNDEQLKIKEKVDSILEKNHVEILESITENVVYSDIIQVQEQEQEQQESPSEETLSLSDKIRKKVAADLGYNGSFTPRPLTNIEATTTTTTASSPPSSNKTPPNEENNFDNMFKKGPGGISMASILDAILLNSTSFDYTKLTLFQQNILSLISKIVNRLLSACMQATDCEPEADDFNLLHKAFSFLIFDTCGGYIGNLIRTSQKSPSNRAFSIWAYVFTIVPIIIKIVYTEKFIKKRNKPIKRKSSVDDDDSSEKKINEFDIPPVVTNLKPQHHQQVINEFPLVEYGGGSREPGPVINMEPQMFSINLAANNNNNSANRFYY